MRKHDVRKWLHAILDLLPVILIPVFMIYSHRHTIDSGSIDVPQNQVVDFNQLINNGLPTSSNDYYTIDNNNLVFNNDHLEMSVGENGNGLYFVLDYYGISSLNLSIDDKYIIRYNIVSNNELDYIAINNVAYSTNVNVHYQYLYLDNLDSLNYLRFIFHYLTNDSTNEISFFKFNLFNVTQMFGGGNEPTLQQFNEWYPSDFYNYTLSHKELLKGTSTITYDDTDIMSQVVYQLYNSVDKYFNMGNVFNMTGVYDWFNLNIFNGNAPISIYIVWNIVLYEFVMDLLFLLYALFMWFIDMVEKLMEKPLKSVK